MKNIIGILYVDFFTRRIIIWIYAMPWICTTSYTIQFLVIEFLFYFLQIFLFHNA